MLKFFFALVASLAVASPMILWAAEDMRLDVLKAGSVVYSNVTILRFSATDLYFKHQGGIQNVKLRYVSPELQKRFGYDPKSEEALPGPSGSQPNVALAGGPVTNAASAAEATKPKSSEDNLLDPISDLSLLGKPAPALPAAKWLGTAPVLKGKCVVFAFLASWSIPSQKFVSEFNALSKQHAGKLVVVGVTSDSESALAEMAEPRMEFPCALDPKGQFASAAGITSVPQILVLDAKGIVHYAGHPNGLTDRKLSSLLAQIAD